MHDLLSTLLDLFRRQAAGDVSAIDGIAPIADLVCGDSVYRHPLLTPQQVRGIELVLAEWRGMFSFEPGRLEGLPPLVRVLTLIRRKAQMDQSEIYHVEAWKEVVRLRGPVEAVQIYRCSSCGTQYPRMGTSGFLDSIDLLCSSCGAVFFKSIYNAPREVGCECGGLAKAGCPSCQSVDGEVVHEMSPYEYFAKHRYHWDSAG